MTREGRAHVREFTLSAPITDLPPLLDQQLSPHIADVITTNMEQDDIERINSILEGETLIREVSYCLD